MKNLEIRLRLLYGFYYDYSFNTGGRGSTSTSHAVEISGLEEIDKDVIQPNMEYLVNRNYFQFINRDTALYVVGATILPDGIDIVEDIFEKSIEDVQSKNTHNEMIKKVLEKSTCHGKISEFWETAKNTSNILVSLLSIANPILTKINQS